MKRNLLHISIFVAIVLVVGISSFSSSNLPTLQVENGATGIFENRQVVPPFIDLAEEGYPSNVLGEETISGDKIIYVDLKNQTLAAYQGDRLFMHAPVSTGLWGKTPPGEYSIWVKMRATRMSGGSGSDYYDLPNVPYNMFFYGPKAPKSSGFALHGAYWHNNFGHAMSHGCVNLRQIDAAKLYGWATPVNTGSITYTDANNTGTKIVIY